MKRICALLIILLLCILPNLNYKEDDFNFIFSFGVQGKNNINTFNKTFTKDLVMAGQETISLNLSQEEKNIILEYVLDEKIFELNGSFKEYLCVMPCDKMELYLYYNGMEKSLSWSTNNIPILSFTTDGSVEFLENEETKDVLKLEKLTRLILEIIKSKKEYKTLPEPTGGYL